jgi:ABC-type lipoprotein export system ATPase subunit
MIHLKQVKPYPLLENGLNPASEVFNTEGPIFEKGKRYLVSAASGKGKSTFLHILYGLRNDYQGDIYWDNKNIKTHTIDDWTEIRQKKLAIIFQDLRLFLNLTGRDNILLKQSLTISSEATPSVSVIETMIEQLGMKPYYEQTGETLSYGQRQRIAIIRALCQPFEYLLLDEPFSHLDKNNIQIATQLIDNACKMQNVGFILVSLGEDYGLEYDKKYVL